MRAVALSALLLAGGCAAPTQEPVGNLVEPPGVTIGTWRAVDAATGRLTDIESLEQLVSQFPDSGSVHARLLSAYVAAAPARPRRPLDRFHAYSRKRQSGMDGTGRGQHLGRPTALCRHGQWDRFGEGGAPVEGKPPLPTQLRALSLAEKLVPPLKNPG